MKRIRRLRTAVGVTLATGLWLAAGFSSTWALGSDYELTGDSSYIEGCFDPCLCPIMMNMSLRGSFQLGSAVQTEGGTVFAVVAVEWRFEQGDDVVLVTGSGEYRIEAGQQRMTLDLLVGNEPVRRFDSGLVPRTGEFPEIIVATAVNGFFCYDYVFEISAAPGPVGETAMTWGGIKGVYR